MKMSFLPMLTLLFIALKLTHYIDWSWWYVTAPSWGLLALVLGFWLTCQLIVLICEVCLRIGETKEQTEKRIARDNVISSLEKMQAALKRNK